MAQYPYFVGKHPNGFLTSLNPYIGPTMGAHWERNDKLNAYQDATEKEPAEKSPFHILKEFKLEELHPQACNAQTKRTIYLLNFTSMVDVKREMYRKKNLNNI